MCLNPSVIKILQNSSGLKSVPVAFLSPYNASVDSCFFQKHLQTLSIMSLFVLKHLLQFFFLLLNTTRNINGLYVGWDQITNAEQLPRLNSFEIGNGGSGQSRRLRGACSHTAISFGSSTTVRMAAFIFPVGIYWCYSPLKWREFLIQQRCW